MRFRRRVWLYRLAFYAAAYLAYCGMVAWRADSYIFADHGRSRAVGRTPPPGGGWEVWRAPLAPDIVGEAWWRPHPEASAERPAPVVLYFHGNAELIDDNLDVADLWNGLGASVLLVEYRGYGRSGGRPRLGELARDATVWFDQLAARPDVAADRIVAHGFSLGGAVAARLSQDRPLAGLVLESTFASLPRMARTLGVWIYLPRERLDSIAALRTLPAEVPVVISHGRTDPVIPVKEGRALAAARPSATYYETDGEHLPWSASAVARAGLVALLAQPDRPD